MGHFRNAILDAEITRMREIAKIAATFAERHPEHPEIEQIRVQAATYEELGNLLAELDDAPEHVHDYMYARGCGVRVCTTCGDHKGLARCYCGWSASGGDGYLELEEMGETIEPEY